MSERSEQSSPAGSAPPGRGASVYQPPRKRANPPQPATGDGADRPPPTLPLPDQIAALRAWGKPPPGRKLGDDESGRVLAWGVDTLDVTINVDWSGPHENGGDVPRLFDVLADAKLRAKGEHPDQADGRDEGKRVKKSEHGEPVELNGPPGWGPLFGNVAAWGVGGYEWLIRCRGLVLKLGKWITPGQRPSMMAEIGAEALWQYGPRPLLLYLRLLIQAQGGRVEWMKVSRADVCVDVLVRDDVLGLDLAGHLVTRARSVTIDGAVRGRVHAVSVGKGGQVMGRIYDKPKEIADKGGGKAWMYDVWGIEAGDPSRVVRYTRSGKAVRERLDHHVPAGHRVLRVEFQLRREALREGQIDSADDLLDRLPSLWKYLAGEAEPGDDAPDKVRGWLRVVDDPSVKRDRQTVVGWWRVVQDGWPRLETMPTMTRDAKPNAERRQLVQQIVGCMTSLIALEAGSEGASPAEVVGFTVAEAFAMIATDLPDVREDGDDATSEVREKLAKWRRGLDRWREAVRVRRAAGRSAMRLRSGQPERKVRVDDGSEALADAYWTRSGVQQCEPDPPAIPAGESEQETPSPPVLEQLGLEFAEVCELEALERNRLGFEG